MTPSSLKWTPVQVRPRTIEALAFWTGNYANHKNPLIECGVVHCCCVIADSIIPTPNAGFKLGCTCVQLCTPMSRLKTRLLRRREGTFRDAEH